MFKYFHVIAIYNCNRVVEGEEQEKEQREEKDQQQRGEK